MGRRLLSVFLATLVGNLFVVAQALAGPRPQAGIDSTARVKAGIVSIGTGADAHATVTLRNKTRLSGYISQAGEEQFVIADPKSGVSTTVSYADVVKLKGRNVATGAKVSIGPSGSGGTVAAAAAGGLAGVAIARTHGRQRVVFIIALAAILVVAIIAAANID